MDARDSTDDDDFTAIILWTCISGLVVYTWSALHVNITQGKSKSRGALDKCGWLVFALLAPQVMLLIAFNQYHTALRLTQDAQHYLPTDPPPAKEESWIKRWGFRSPQPAVSSQEGASSKHAGPPFRDGAWSEGESLEKEDPPAPDLEAQVSELGGSSTATAAPLGDAAAPSQPRRKYPWTLTHGFYAVMGGFVLQNPHDPPGQNRYLPSWQGNGVLTPEGVRLLMQNAPELIPDIPLAELLDRNKMDGLAKILFVWHVLWFLLNRIGTPQYLTLLEISTIAHLLCALFTYCFWWRKPRDVKLPTIIMGDSTEVARQLGAWMSAASGAQRCLVGGLFTFLMRPECAFDPYATYMVDHPTTSAGPTIDVTDFVRRDDVHQQTLTRTYPGYWKMKFVFRGSLPWYIAGSTTPSTLEERNCTLRRFHLAMEARAKYPILKSHVPSERRTFIVPNAQLQTSTALSNIAPLKAVLLIAAYGWPYFLGFYKSELVKSSKTLWKIATALMIGSAIAVVVLGKVFQKDSDVPLNGMRKGVLWAVTIVHFFFQNPPLRGEHQRAVIYLSGLRNH